MQIIYIYLAETMENIAQPMAVSYDEFKSDPNRFYPPWNSETMIFSDKLVTNAILDEKSRELRKMTKDELYKAGKYTLAENELIENGKIKAVELSEYEYIENNQVKFKRDEKIKSLKKELSALKVEYSEKEFLFQGKYWQKNREKGDRDNLTGIVVLLMATGQKEYDGWKVLDKDTREHIYLKLSLDELKILALHMQEQVTKAMKSESALISKLSSLSDGELKLFNAREEFEKLWS